MSQLKSSESEGVKVYIYGKLSILAFKKFQVITSGASINKGGDQKKWVVGHHNFSSCFGWVPLPV